MPLSTLPLRPVVWKVVIPVWAAIPAMFVRFTPQPAIRSMRPAACSFSSARSGAPRAALAACPEDRIVRQPRGNGVLQRPERVARHVERAVERDLHLPCAGHHAAHLRKVQLAVRVSAPMTTPFAPRSRKAAISSHISSSSGSV